MVEQKDGQDKTDKKEEPQLVSLPDGSKVPVTEVVAGFMKDIDYRKKYAPTYFRNRYFRGQFLMAQKCYRPQMQVCDLVVDTTGAAIWATPEIAGILSKGS